MLFQAVLKRILIGFATLTVVSIIIFIGTSLLPGDVAEIILGQMATPESLAALREKLGMSGASNRIANYIIKDSSSS